MTCKNCDPWNSPYPGAVIKVIGNCCAECGRPILKNNSTDHKSWDQYFHRICEAVASKSPCLSRKIGAILVRDHSIISTGFNGPSRGVPHCGYDRLTKDKLIRDLMPQGRDTMKVVESHCPRKVLGYESGTHMELCPAVHAEANAVIDAARKGASTIGTTLYMNCIIPCKSCYGLLINAGIVEIVVDDTKVYDKHTQYLIDNSSIKIRKFNL